MHGNHVHNLLYVTQILLHDQILQTFQRPSGCDECMHSRGEGISIALCFSKLQDIQCVFALQYLSNNLILCDTP